MTVNFTEPLLTVCIPVITSRLSVAFALLKKLDAQAVNNPVEVLSIVDNKTVPLHEKRNLMITMAAGRYIANLDDDDDVSDDYVHHILAAATAEADVISFNQISQLGPDAQPFHVITGMQFDNTDASGDTLFRKPWHWCAWRSELAKRAKFVEAWNEDGLWLGQLWPQVKKEHHIDEVLHYYRYNRATTTFT